MLTFMDTRLAWGSSLSLRLHSARDSFESISDTDAPDWVFRGITHTFRSSTRIVPWNRPEQTPTKSLPTQFRDLISFNAIKYAVKTASLNRMRLGECFKDGLRVSFHIIIFDHCLAWSWNSVNKQTNKQTNKLT